MIIDAAAAMPLRYALSLRAMSRRHFCFCRRCYYFSPDYAVFRLRLRFAVLMARDSDIAMVYLLSNA